MKINFAKLDELSRLPGSIERWIKIPENIEL
jgi:hypothetical protein